ncbi:MAG: DNA repair protein RecO, partial [Dehalococcoidia bacterium]|nr:DNA repair protein RecO [Dehalococcoidia bacterium]
SSLALYTAELVVQFTAEHLENYPIYKLFLDTLHHLCETDNGELTLRYFELNLLAYLGYKPELHRCLGCKSPLEPRANLFSASGGGVLCPACREKELLSQPISLNALKAMRFLQESDYAKASRLRINESLSRELENIMRHYIRYILEREVKSVAWLDRLRQER